MILNLKRSACRVSIMIIATMFLPLSPAWPQEREIQLVPRPAPKSEYFEFNRKRFIPEGFSPAVAVLKDPSGTAAKLQALLIESPTGSDIQASHGRKGQRHPFDDLSTYEVIDHRGDVRTSRSCSLRTLPAASLPGAADSFVVTLMQYPVQLNRKSLTGTPIGDLVYSLGNDQSATIVFLRRTLVVSLSCSISRYNEARKEILPPESWPGHKAWFDDLVSRLDDVILRAP